MDDDRGSRHGLNVAMSFAMYGFCHIRKHNED